MHRHVSPPPRQGTIERAGDTGIRILRSGRRRTAQQHPASGRPPDPSHETVETSCAEAANAKSRRFRHEGMQTRAERSPPPPTPTLPQRGLCGTTVTMSEQTLPRAEIAEPGAKGCRFRHEGAKTAPPAHASGPHPDANICAPSCFKVLASGRTVFPNPQQQRLRCCRTGGQGACRVKRMGSRASARADGPSNATAKRQGC